MLAIDALEFRRTGLVREMNAGVVIGRFTRLFESQIKLARLARKNCLHLVNDLSRLEGLAVILENQIPDAETGLGSQVARKLSVIVAFDADGPLCPPENLGDLAPVKRMEVLDLKVIGDDSLLRKKSDSFTDDTSRRSPANERDFRLLRPFQAWHRQILERQVHLAHTLFLVSCGAPEVW